jgi:hypothetical protein
MTVREAHAQFKASHPEVKIAKSKFASLRLKFILTCDETPNNVCVCQIHYNFIEKIKALKCFIPDMPLYGSSWLETCVVCSPSEQCYFNECDACKNGSRLPALEVDDDSVQVSTNQWQKRDNEILKREQLAKVRVIQPLKSLYEVSGLIETFFKHPPLTYTHAITVFQEFKDQVPSFARHHFIKQRSAAYSQNLKALASPKNIVLQIDFAENFTCKFQDEIQSAHWRQNQITVFTACIWNGSDKPLSYVVVSDNDKHDKHAVVAYMVQLLRTYQLDSPAMVELNVVSDGPSSQMKNRYIFAILVSQLR